ncbi:MAG: hypothetical protein MZV63_31285 [Marinilabiliales bacterium]|nr:hypothetical protein [Marinilabiliales bacterium]
MKANRARSGNSESHSRPHYAKDEKGEWIAYVRVNDQNIQANRVLVAACGKMKEKRKGRLLNYGREEK